MKRIKPTALVLIWGFLSVAIAGCMENIALIGRPTIEEGQDDVIGEIERVDFSTRQIYLRPNGSGRRIVPFSANAQVLDRGSEYPVARLSAGDRVAMQLKKDSSGLWYADLIRIQQTESRSRDEVSSAASRIETLSGRVQTINRLANSFELDDQFGSPVLVLLSDDVRDSDRVRFRNLHVDDRVTIEGRFTSRERFEMLSFLNDDAS